jgi:LuxR family quorum sensing-dependent transcriptional regulator
MSRKALDQTLQHIRDLDRAHSPGEVCAILLRAVGQFGFQNVLAGSIPVPGLSRRQQEAHVLLHEWPVEWSERYFSKGYLYRDPTIRRVTAGIEPFLWSELEGLDDDPAAQRVMDEATDFRLHDGFTVPLITLDGEVAGFSLAGPRIELPAQGRGMLTLLATYALAKTMLIRDRAQQQQAVVLSKREVEVLQWAAEGKTEWEIGAILGISEHTSEKFLRSARAKLSAVNRTHAVAEAIRLGLIQ